MQIPLTQIAQMLSARIQGNTDILISNIAKIQEAKTGDITFLANPKYEPYVYTTQASAVIVSKNFQAKHPIQATLLIVEDAYTAFSTLLQAYEKVIHVPKRGIEQPCFIDAKASVGKEVYIGAFAYLAEGVQVGDFVQIYPNTYIGENVTIGENTVIYSGVKIYKNCKIGSNCIIHAGAVIGSDGFGFAPKSDGSYQTIPQLGNVVIEDNVSIGANTTIDRATLGSTIIKKGVKIDNLVQIAHNVVIGENTVIAAQTGIAGSTTVGANCMIGGQVGIAGHLKIADKVNIGAQSGIGGDILQENTTWQGSPAIDLKEYYKAYAIFKKLPEIYRKISTIERQLQEK